MNLTNLLMVTALCCDLATGLCFVAAVASASHPQWQMWALPSQVEHPSEVQQEAAWTLCIGVMSTYLIICLFPQRRVASAKGVVRAVSGVARERAWWGDLAWRRASQDVRTAGILVKPGCLES